MEERSAVFVAFDTAKTKHAVAVAMPGRDGEVRYLGEVVNSPAAVERHIRELDRLGEELRGVERDIARRALDDAVVRRLMTVPGIGMVVATGLAAAIDDADRFASPEQLVAYLGLNPSVRQSGEGPAHHGRIRLYVRRREWGGPLH